MTPAAGKNTLSRLVSCTLRPATGVENGIRTVGGDDHGLHGTKSAIVFRIITCNLNGIRAAARKGFFRWMREQRPDIVAFKRRRPKNTSSRPKRSTSPSSVPRSLTPRRKAIAAWRSTRGANPTAIVRGLGMQEYDVEGRFVRMDFGDDFSVASLYVPSGTSGPARQAVKEEFLDRFIAQLVQMKNEGRRIVICGDYNIAHRDIDVFDPKVVLAHDRLPAAGTRVVRRRHRPRGLGRRLSSRQPEPRQFSWWANFPAAWTRDLGLAHRLSARHAEPRAGAVRAASIYKDERFSDHAPVTIDYEF